MSARLVTAPLLALAVLVLAAPVLAEPAPLALGPIEGLLNRFELFDISLAKGFAAYRVTAHGTYADENGPYGSVKCRYPGMKAYPKSGVVIRSWDLGAGKAAQSWTLYAIAERSSECSAKAVNERNLAAANAAITALGLDMTRKPSLVRARRGRLTLRVGGKKRVVRIRVQPKASQNNEAGTATATVALSIGQRTIFHGSHEYETMGEATCAIKVLGAYVEGEQAVFVLAVTTGDIRLEPTTRIGFTKPISLAD